MKVHECPFCKEKLRVKKLECMKCGIGFEGDFYSSPVLSLSEEQQSFIELFVLSSGSLKEMAELLGVTYPTVRARLDEVIKGLKKAIKDREGYTDLILEKVAQGKLDPKKAADIIKSL